MYSERCLTCQCYDKKKDECSYWVVGCMYNDEEEDTDDSGDEQQD